MVVAWVADYDDVIVVGGVVYFLSCRIIIMRCELQLYFFKIQNGRLKMFRCGNNELEGGIF